jgi:S-formylglutathione hydrolase FrmB
VAPNSAGAQFAAIVLVVVLAVDTAMVWNRVRDRWGWLVRSVALVLCATTALAAAGIWVNRQLNLFTTWSEVAGHRPVAPATGQTTIDQELPSGGRIVSFNVPGPHSGISLAAKAYLPPGYDSPLGRRTHYPVIEALAGFPGTPNLWVVSLHAGDALDHEIAAGRMAPAVVVFPLQDFDQATDSECVDAAGGAKFDTFLTEDVRAAVTAQFRVRADRAGWGIMGASTGGFCATNLAMRHPDLYGAAASLSGYFTAITDRTTGDLYRGDQRLRNENSPLWRLNNLPVPALPIFLSVAADDRNGYKQLQDFQAAVRPPMRLTTMVVASGGHTGAVWRTVLPALFDWFAGWLAAPVISPEAGPAKPIPTHGPVKEGLYPNCAPGPECPGNTAGARPGPSGRLDDTMAKNRLSPVSLRKNGPDSRPQ